MMEPCETPIYCNILKFIELFGIFPVMYGPHVGYILWSWQLVSIVENPAGSDGPDHPRVHSEAERVQMSSKLAKKIVVETRPKMLRFFLFCRWLFQVSNLQLKDP